MPAGRRPRRTLAWLLVIWRSTWVVAAGCEGPAIAFHATAAEAIAGKVRLDWPSHLAERQGLPRNRSNLRHAARPRSRRVLGRCVELADGLALLRREC